MEKPKLSRMFETFIKIGLPDQISHKMLFDIMRLKIYPLVSNLREKGVISWYHFMFHNRESGVPTTEDDNNLYFHIRVSLADNVKPDDFESMLKDCVKTRQCDQKSIDHIDIVKDISGKVIRFDASLLESEEIEEVWKFIGEQSEWLLRMIDAHKRDVDIPLSHIHSFLHDYCNITQLFVICPCCKKMLNSENLIAVTL